MAGALASTGWAQTASEPAAATKVSLRQHGPAKIHGRSPDNTVYSENWSGYAVTGSSFTQAMGSWIVPTVNCTTTPGTRSTPTYSSFWVGIDGYSSSTVEQIGTDSDCDGLTPTYYAWYEFYPAPSYNINSLTISPGDKISASVTYNGSQFTVTLTDENTGKSFSTTQSVRGAKRSSAEWIAESPCCARHGAFLPLSDFGTVDFGALYTNVGNTDDAEDTASPSATPISGFGTFEQINMVTSSGALETTTSPLSGGTSFTVQWNSE